MKKLLIILLVLCFCLTGCGNNNSTDNQEESNNYTVSRTTTLSTNVNNNKSENNNTFINDNESFDSINTETEIASFSTKIYTPNDKARQNNIRITCSKLNETVVKSGETFSFCDTIGKATPEEGYQKADIFDKDGNVVKGYGGGNCQISSTLYNALLKLPDISILERHEHSKKVYYVEDRQRCRYCLWKYRF